MIETYGQTPARLFSEPHPDRKRSNLDQYISWSGTYADIEGQIAALRYPPLKSPLKSSHERNERGLFQGKTSIWTYLWTYY